MITVYVYEKCSACKKAITFLRERNISFEKKEIKETPPSLKELEKMLEYFELKKLFNSSGNLYKELGLSKNLPGLSREEALQLLSKEGMLVKRPFLLGENFGCLGFSEKTWSQIK